MTMHQADQAEPPRMDPRARGLFILVYGLLVVIASYAVIQIALLQSYLQGNKAYVLERDAQWSPILDRIDATTTRILERLERLEQERAARKTQGNLDIKPSLKRDGISGAIHGSFREGGARVCAIAAGSVHGFMVCCLKMRVNRHVNA
jgi:hypothetical protein